jgi:hypothetical protein
LRPAPPIEEEKQQEGDGQEEEMPFTAQKYILETFCFLLQVCQYLLEAAKCGDVNTTVTAAVNVILPLTHP